MLEPALDEQIAAVRDTADACTRIGLNDLESRHHIAALRAALATLERPAPALFVDGEFTAHSGAILSFKIDCDTLSDSDIATLSGVIAKRVGAFGSVIGVPRGGIRIADALRRYATAGPTLTVDDVLTTGASMEEARQSNLGAVLFARGPCPDWIYAVFVTGDEHERIKQERDAARAELAQLQGWYDELSFGIPELRERHERAMAVVEAGQAWAADIKDAGFLAQTAMAGRPRAVQLYRAIAAFDAAETEGGGG